MVSPVIIKFKRYPELGRLRVVDDEEAIECGDCALADKDCWVVDHDRPDGMSCGDGYKYEKVK